MAGCFSFGYSNVTEMIFAGNKTYTECKNGYQMSPLDITVVSFSWISYYISLNYFKLTYGKNFLFEQVM